MENLTRVGHVGRYVSADQTASSLATLDRCYGSRKHRKRSFSAISRVIVKAWLNHEFPVAISIDSKQS